MKNNTLINNLTEGSVTKQLIAFSIPFVLSNALQSIYNIVDMVVVGQFVGSTGLSAVSIGGQLVWLLACLGIGYGSGGQIYISQQVGAGDHEGVRRTIGTVFTSTMLFAVLFTIIGVALHTTLLDLLNTPSEAMADAVDYLIICSGGMIFVYGYNVVSAILRGMGDSKRPLLFIGIASVTNLILDLVFVAGLGMGAAGAAWATILGQALSFIVSLIYLYHHREQFGFDFKPRSFAIDPNTFKSLSKLGLPLAVQTSAINISMLFVSAYINAYGLVYSAVYGIGSKLHSIMLIVTNALNASGATMMGQNLGAGKPERVKKIFHMVNLICIVFCAIVSVILLIFPEQVFRLFTSDAEVLSMAPRYMVVTVVMFLGFATMSAGLALVNGVGNGMLSLVIALLDGVVARIALSLLLGITFNMGAWGFFWGNSLAGFVSVILGNFYYFSGLWKKRKLMV
jgi:putative MATE family efflux protein